MWTKRKMPSAIIALLMLAISTYAAPWFNVKIIDRKNSDTRCTYIVPGSLDSTSSTDVDCHNIGDSVNCSGSTKTTGSSTPPLVGSYDVHGATLSLQLPNGRVAVVNCQSKYSPKFDHVNRRSCRVPLVNSVQAQFDRDRAKLIWSVSIDGKRMQSETYKILAVLDKR